MVKIPESLLFQLIDLLELWDTSGCGFCINQNKEEALCALRDKRDALARRTAYSKIVAAKNDSDRHDARIDYLKLKNEGAFPL
jgi:hypothetical protein